MIEHTVPTPRWPLAVLLLLFSLVLVFGASMAATGRDVEEQVLGSTFGAGMGLFGLLLSVRAARGDRGAWLALWYLPLFFAAHVIYLEVWVPDLPLLLLSLAALVVLRPRRDN